MKAMVQIDGLNSESRDQKTSGVVDDIIRLFESAGNNRISNKNVGKAIEAISAVVEPPVTTISDCQFHNEEKIELTPELESKITAVLDSIKSVASLTTDNLNTTEK